MGGTISLNRYHSGRLTLLLFTTVEHVPAVKLLSVFSRSNHHLHRQCFDKAGDSKCPHHSIFFIFQLLSFKHFKPTQEIQQLCHSGVFHISMFPTSIRFPSPDSPLRLEVSGNGVMVEVVNTDSN